MDITNSIKKYKNSVTRKYISISNDEIDIIKKGDYWLSKKFDGQLWFYCKSNKNSKIINSNENDISNIVKDIKNGYFTLCTCLSIVMLPCQQRLVITQI